MAAALEMEGTLQGRGTGIATLSGQQKCLLRYAGPHRHVDTACPSSLAPKANTHLAVEKKEPATSTELSPSPSEAEMATVYADPDSSPDTLQVVRSLVVGLPLLGQVTLPLPLFSVNVYLTAVV